MIVDLCSGVGWAEGLRRYLSLHEIGLDIDAAVCATRRTAGFETIRADIATYPTGHLAGKIRGLIASPPCQPFSKAGKRLGLRDQPAIFAHIATVARAGRWLPYPVDGWHDQRSPLVLEPLRWALEVEPEWIALEQVADVLPLWRAYAHVLERRGYSVWAGVLCAADYGVAQERYRAILAASRTGRAVPPRPTHHEHGGPELGGGDLPRWVSMAEALGWGWSDPARTVAGHRAPRWAYQAGDGTGRVLTGNSTKGGTRPGLERLIDRPTRTIDSASRQWTLHTGRDQRPDRPSGVSRPAAGPAPAITGKDGGRWQLRTGNHDRAFDRSVPRPLSQPAPTVMVGHTLAQWAWERPATTIQGDQRIPRPGPGDRAGGEHQQDQAVRVTLEELAVLQGFDSAFPFMGNKTQRSQQIGNAVPPPLAAAIVGALLGMDREIAA